MSYIYRLQRVHASPCSFSLLSLFTLITCGNSFPHVSTVLTFDLILFWSDCHQKEKTISILLFNPHRWKNLIDENVECKIIIKIW